MDVRWPFVGRTDELRLIREALSGAAGILLSGPAGVGKTRLAYEAVTGADPRRYVSTWAVATSATTPIPLGALAPLLPADLPTAINRVGLLRVAADALLRRCESRRLVLGIDDAHLLDDVSAALVHQLAHTGTATVLVSVRWHEPAPQPITALWKDELVTRIEVRPLSESQTADVLVAVLGGQVDGVTCRRLWDATQGNLLLLRELVHAGLDNGVLVETAGMWRWNGPWVLAPRLVELISARIGRLEPAERDVLETLAYGEPVGVDVLTAVASERAVEQVETMGLLWVRRDGRRTDVWLGHPLYGELLRARCSVVRARRIRRRLAVAVEATGARRKDDWLRIATWRLDAAEPVRPAVLVAAARRALAVLDLRLAERLARTAFDAGDLKASEVLWRVLFFLQRGAELEEIMARLADQPLTDDQRGEYAFGRAYNLFWGLDQVEQAEDLLRVVRAVLGDTHWLAEIDVLLCVFNFCQGRTAQALERIGTMRGGSPRGSRAEAQLSVVEGSMLIHIGQLRTANDVLEEAAAALAGWAEQIPWVVEFRRLFNCLGVLYAGRLAEGAGLAAQFYAHGLETQWAFPLRLACGIQAVAARLQGRVRTAARWGYEGRRAYKGIPQPIFGNHVLGELAHAEALLGRTAQATAALVDADRRPVRSETMLRPWIEIARTWVAVASGDRPRGIQLARDAASYARDQQAVVLEAFALHDAVRLGAAREVVHRLDELVTVTDSALVRVLADHAGAAITGDADKLGQVGAAFADMGAALLASEAFIQSAHAYHRSGKSANERAQRGKAALLLDRCEGARTPILVSLQAPRLTAREHDIARLAAEGLSNQQIADRLMISNRTVGNHLYNIYSKLGVEGRSALAGWLIPDKSQS